MSYAPTTFDLLNIETTLRPVPDPVPVPQDTVWFIAAWADGTWCDWEDRHEFTHMSDDYRKERVTHVNDDGAPVRTEFA